MAAVIIRDSYFRELEMLMGTIAHLLMPTARLNEFAEFHACELYGGFGVFEGIEQQERFNAIKFLLSVLKKKEIPVVYGAVNIDRLKDMVYASADPLDIAFRICCEGVEKWLYGTA